MDAEERKKIGWGPRDGVERSETVPLILSDWECQQLAEHSQMIIDIVAGFYELDFNELKEMHAKFLEKLDPMNRGIFTLEHLYYCLGHILVTSHK